MWLQTLGVAPELCDEGMRMSRRFLAAYAAGELQPLVAAAPN
jgi:hypothetical protein